MISHLCKQTCDIQRGSDTAQNGGGIARTFSNVYTGLPCSLQIKAPSSRTGQQFDTLTAQYLYMLYIDGVYDLRVNDRVTIDSAYYLVQGAGDTAGRGTFTTAYVTRIDQ